MRIKDIIVWKIGLLYKRWCLWIDTIVDTVEEE